MTEMMNKIPDHRRARIGAPPALPALPMVYVAHETSGRVRFRIPSLKRDCQGGRGLGEAVGSLAGVTAAEVKPLTGSLIVQFDGCAETRNGIFAVLAEQGYCISEQPSPELATKSLPSLNAVVAGALVDLLLQKALHLAIGGII